MDDPLIFATEPAGRMLWANDALERHTGYTVGDFQHDSADFMFIHPDDLARVGAHFAVFATSDATRSEPFDTRFFTKWGEVQRYRGVLTKIVHDGQAAFRVVCHRVRYEQTPQAALAESEDRYRRLVEAATDAILRVDGDSRLLYWNPRFQRWVGADNTAVRGVRLTDLVHPDDQAQVAEAIRHAVTHGDSRFYTTLRRPDGSMRWVGVRAVGLREAEDSGTVQAILRDLTETRELEERLRQAQKLESLGVMAGGIAHDFNNLLTAIVGRVGLAQRGLADCDDIAVHLQAIQVATQRAAGLTRSMLAYSGQAVLKHRAIDLDTLVHDVASLVRAAMTSRVKIEVLQSPKRMRVHGDEAQIAQVVLNLVTNAGESYQGDRGMVHVRSWPVDRATLDDLVGSWPTGRPTGEAFACIEVSDMGAGMAPETLERMFDPFFSTKAQGRGLGLSAVLGIVLGHHGAVNIETTEGVGTHLRVLFPRMASLDAPVRNPTPAPAEPRRGLLTGHVLLIDDEPDLLAVGLRVLKSFGLRVTPAPNGRRGLSALAAAPDAYAVVVLDETMPGLTGSETLSRMRETHPTLPVLRVSGYALTPLQTDAHTAFLAKPYTISQLRNALSTLLRADALGA